MEDISSADAYYSVSSFSNLASTLKTIAGQMCGGTITVNKKLDVDGKLITTNDQSAGGTGFTFDITPGLPGQVTDSNGQTPAVAVTAGSYSVKEVNVPSGFTALGGSCSGATNNGTASGTMVSGITVGTNDIVSCTFFNQPSPSGGSTSTPSSTDVSILKTVDKPKPNIGDTVTFTTVVKNNGPDTATGVVATDPLPAGLTFVSSTSTVGSYNASTSSWSIGGLLNGKQATTTITAIVNSGTAARTITNTATVTSTSLDSNSNNNSSSASIIVAQAGGGGGTTPSADLSIIKIVDNATPNPGDTIVYTLVVMTLEPAASSTATDTIPSAVTFVSSTSTMGSYNASTSLWTIGNLVSGAFATTTITVLVNSGTAGQSVLNTAIAAATTFDPNLGNNTASAGGSVAGPQPSGGGTTNGGCSGNCGSSGGGGGGGGGYSGSGGRIGGSAVGPNTGGGGLSMPTAQPQVLAASTELPRTGMPIGFIIFALVSVLGLLNLKFKLV